MQAGSWRGDPQFEALAKKIDPPKSIGHLF
jgi:hypothetical protein